MKGHGNAVDQPPRQHIKARARKVKPVTVTVPHKSSTERSSPDIHREPSRKSLMLIDQVETREVDMFDPYDNKNESIIGVNIS